MDKFAATAIATILANNPALMPLVLGTTIGAGAGVAGHMLHPETSNGRPMWSDALIGATIGALPGAMIAVPNRLNRLFGNGQNVMHAADPISMGLSGGILADRIVSGGDHPGYGAGAGILSSLMLAPKKSFLEPFMGKNIPKAFL